MSDDVLGLRALVLAAERTEGVARIQVLDRLAEAVRARAGDELLQVLEVETVSQTARALGVTRNAVQDRARRRRASLGGGS